MHHSISTLGVVQGCQNALDALQAELGGLDLVSQGVEEPDGIGIADHGLLRRYTSQAETIIAAVPIASFPSKSQTFLTSAEGTTEEISARAVTAQPHTALSRFPAFHALPKM